MKWSCQKSISFREFEGKLASYEAHPFWTKELEMKG